MQKEINQISSKADFLKFLDLYIQDFRKNGESWENRTLNDFLEGLANWIEDMEGYYDNMNLPKPNDVNWRFFADMLYAAKMYE